VSFLVAPVQALILVRVVPLDPAHATRLLLPAGAAGPPFLPKLTATAGGDMSRSLALMVLLMVVSLLFQPLVMPLIVPGIQADVPAISDPLVVLLPVRLAIGLALAGRGKEKTGKVLARVRKVSDLSFVPFLLALGVLPYKAVLQILGSLAIGAALLS
jgi:BASS family bile acid:Na+ symporter